MNGFLHRLWQHLPRRMRRTALFAGSTLLAPRPTPKANGGPPFIVGGALRTASGLGESARLCHDALAGAGLPVRGIDLTADLMQPKDLGAFSLDDGRSCEGSGTLILHVNGPLVPLAMARLGRRLVRDKRIVAYWAWELPRVPADWRYGLPFIHEIWVPSHFVADAVRPIAAGRPVRVIPHPVALRGSPPQRGMRATDRPFSVLSVFNMASSFARKNPIAAINAFRLAFGSDPCARMTIKIINGVAFPEGLERMRTAAADLPNISFVDDSTDRHAINTLYQSADVVISLHRSEGFGLVPAEAMLRGLPTIATGWSGNMDFMNDENSVPVPYTLVPAKDPQGTYEYPDTVWAEPDVCAAAVALRCLSGSTELRARMGARASSDVRARFDPMRFAATVRDCIARASADPEVVI